MELISHDARIAKAFIRPDKRDRFVDHSASRQLDADGRIAIASRKKFGKYRVMLASMDRWFDPRCPSVPLGVRADYAGVRAAFAASDSGSSVYVMSIDAHLDGMMMGLDHVLDYLSKYSIDGALIVNASHSLAYYEQSELDAMTRLLSPVTSRSRAR